jgi:uncharacterized protein (TIGR02687 family)
MLKDKIESYFQRFTSLKILFFFDEKEQYKSEVENLELDNIKVKYYQNNPFSMKYSLLNELANEKVFLYLPMKQPNRQDEYLQFPLLGLLIANKELQLDNVGEFMEQYHLQRHQKPLIEKYIKDLQYAKIQDVCHPVLKAEKLNEKALQKALVSAFVGFKQIEDWDVIAAKIIANFILDESEFIKLKNRISSLNFLDELVANINSSIASQLKEFTLDEFYNLINFIQYNRICINLEELKSKDPYAHLKIKENRGITRFIQFIYGLEKQPSLKNKFLEVVNSKSQKIKGDVLVNTYGIDASFEYYSDDIIIEIFSQLQSNLLNNSSATLKQLDKIGLQAEFNKDQKTVFNFLYQSSKLLHELSQINGLTLDTVDEYLNLYVGSWYKIDYYYRLSIVAYRSIDNDKYIKDFSLLENIYSHLNDEYNKFSNDLNFEWLKCLNEVNFDYQKIQSPKQYDFYKNQIENIEQKTVVIISDALRYESANELLSNLHQDSKNQSELAFMLASLPSKTNVGMAQLLPHNTIQYNDGKIKIDEISSNGTDNRSKILDKYQKGAKAVQYTDVEKLTLAEARELFKSKLVYVYHDLIDATGDNRKSESRTFNAVNGAIVELRSFVKKLQGSYNVANVYITADHGFLYTDKTLEEKDLEKWEGVSEDNFGNRYAISKTEMSNNMIYSFPLGATSKFKDDYWVNIPKSLNRYSKSGVGQQFAHGGGSLQELVIPLISSTRKRNEISKKVDVQLNNRRLRIVSSSLLIDLFQVQAISSQFKDRTIIVALYDNNNLVSNVENMTMNFYSENLSERAKRITLTLLNNATNSSTLKLKVFDVDDLLNPLIEELVINDTLIETDF